MEQDDVTIHCDMRGLQDFDAVGQSLSLNV